MPGTIYSDGLKADAACGCIGFSVIILSVGGSTSQLIRGKYESQYEYYCWRNG